MWVAWCFVAGAEGHRGDPFDKTVMFGSAIRATAAAKAHASKGLSSTSHWGGPSEAGEADARCTGVSARVDHSDLVI